MPTSSRMAVAKSSASERATRATSARWAKVNSVPKRPDPGVLAPNEPSRINRSAEVLIVRLAHAGISSDSSITSKLGPAMDSASSSAGFTMLTPCGTRRVRWRTMNGRVRLAERANRPAICDIVCSAARSWRSLPVRLTARAETASGRLPTARRARGANGPLKSGESVIGQHSRLELRDCSVAHPSLELLSRSIAWQCSQIPWLL